MRDSQTQIADTNKRIENLAKEPLGEVTDGLQMQILETKVQDLADINKTFIETRWKYSKPWQKYREGSRGL